MADVFSSETGAAGAPSRPLPQAEATVQKDGCGMSRSTYDKAGVREGGRGCRKYAAKMQNE